VLSRYEPHPVNAAAVAAAQEAGIPFNDDSNGEHLEGVAFAQLNIKDDLRHGVASAFLAPVADAANLQVLTGAHVLRLLIEDGRCCGVEVALAGGIECIRAEGEVVVCAGTVESPKLLMLSGIGPGDELARLGIPVAADLPGVGRHLHDHVLSPVIYAASRAVPPPRHGLQPLHSHLFWHSRPGLPGPDVQPLFFHLPLYLEGMEGPADGYTLMAGIIRPASRGALRLASTDPAAPPLIDPACLSCEVDVAALVAALELCREIGSQSALAGWRGDELYPGPHVRTASELREYVRRTAVTYHHQVGTCKMGVDEQAVVDPQLRVRGIEGLRVADASVMPSVSSGNTHAPTVMIGERAAELVREAIGLGRAAAPA
jgi:choline dehydrogenase